MIADAIVLVNSFHAVVLALRHCRMEVITNGDSPVPEPPVDVKSLWEDIKIRFERNKESKKMHKTIQKKQYENFEDANMKLLRSLPPAWNNIALIMRNKPDIETLNMDDLYNNLKVYKAEIKGQSRSGSNSHNVAFVSSENTSSINETINATHDIHVAGSKEQPSASSYVDDVMFSFFASQSNTPRLYNEDLEQIDTDDLEEMDLKWQVAMLTMRVNKFMKRTERNLNFNGNDPIGFDKTKVECYNFHKRGHFARECRAPKNQVNRSADNERIFFPVETPASALVTVRSSSLIIEDWESDYEDKCEDKTLTEQEISAIATKSGQVLVNAAKQNSAASTSTARPSINLGLAVLVDAAEFCLAALTSTCPDLVATAVGIKFLLDEAVATKSGQVLVNAAKQNSAASTSTARPRLILLQSDQM
nr:hypothetical protein [Tanacetum cinerariifolium]